MRWRSISKLVLPDPMTTAARSSVAGTGPAGQDPADLVAAREVRRQLTGCAVTQATEVDDLVHARGGRGIAEVLGRGAVASLPVRVRADRVDEVVGDVDPAEGLVERRTIEHVSLRDLDMLAPGLGVQLGGGARQASHLATRSVQLSDETAADVPGGAGHQHSATRNRPSCPVLRSCRAERMSFPAA